LKSCNTPRRIAIILAAILGLVAALYLGGLLSQLMHGYQTWLSQNTFDNSTAMPAPNFSPLYCIANAFNAEGLKATAIIIGLALIGFLYMKFQGKFNRGDYDDRNFKRAREGTYGTAAWMSDKEMKSVLEVTTPAAAMGTILGEKNGKVICLPDNTKLNKHIFACGATGTMKSRAVVRNLLFQTIKRGESVVLTDSKSELYADTAELFRQNGYQVRVFNLVNPEHSDSWNCMSGLAGDTLITQILTDVIISNTAKGNPDHFWGATR